jgi:hypothetical protein
MEKINKTMEFPEVYVEEFIDGREFSVLVT